MNTISLKDMTSNNVNAISLKNVTKEYKGFTLDNISFDLPKGCIMGLVGENGAGKSTLIKIICGNVSMKNWGEISLLGEKNVENFFKLRQNIGIVPDEISFPHKFKVKHVDKMMSYVFERWDGKAFNDYVDRFEIPRHKKFKDYSLGMKKKLGIAVALSHNAELIILDEATSGLDPVVRDDFLDILNDFTRDENHSVLFSSHIVSDLEKLCDYIAVLHKGKLIMCEEKDVLLDNYCMLRCSDEELRAVRTDAVVGKRESPYGVQAIVRREAVPGGADIGNVTIEDIFVYMVKGEIK